MKPTWSVKILALATLGSTAGGCQQEVRPDEMSAQAHRQEAAQVAEHGGFESPDRRLRHAQQHLAAAAYLEAFEQAECKDLPPASRAACPLLGPVTHIADVTGGVRVWFVDRIPVDTTLAHMRCHLAYAQTAGFEAATACPLYVRGVEIIRATDPHAIDILSKDTKVAAEIRKRAREEALVVRGASP